MILMQLRSLCWPFCLLGYVMVTHGEMSDLWTVFIFIGHQFLKAYMG
jgi:hypothetical protein